MSQLAQLQQELEQLADPKQQAILQRFFKTGKGEYGEGDIFLGIKVPVQRQLAKKYHDLPLIEIPKLLHSPIHEHRLTALLLLINLYIKATAKTKNSIFEFYLNNVNHINNWDLVDLSAPPIVGDYLLDKSRAILYQLAHSDHLWQKRIAILATFTFIKHHQFDDTLKLATILLHDQHDLIHKAVGWMLREVGKRNQAIEEAFLNQHFQEMPRTMLRYAIEKFAEEKRKSYLYKRRSQPEL
jgi:3-methyladenine DNA glycosylase AlkD